MQELDSKVINRTADTVTSFVENVPLCYDDEYVSITVPVAVPGGERSRVPQLVRATLT